MATKILIVEDTIDIRDALVITFTEAGFRVAAAATGEEAFIELAKFTPDIVLLDVHLPGISGLDILKQMRKTLSVPILMYTNSASSEFVKDAIQAGASDYVLKDTGMAQLIERVQMRLGAASEPAVSESPVDATDNPTIMYVGQDVAVQRLITDTSRRLAIESTRVTTAKVALSRLSNDRSAIVVTELELRDGGGMNFVRELKRDRQFSNVPIVMVAENAPPELRRSALSHGATAFYIKPISAIEFEQLVRKLLRSAHASGAA